jgi:ligand-binding sensor domain-containing protein
LDSEITPTLGKSLLKKGRFAISKQGDIWIGGNEGLIGWNWKNNLTQRYRRRPNDNNSIGSDTIWNVYLAKDETVWLKTTVGISIFYPSEKKFENYFHNSENRTGLGPNRVNHFLDDGKGNMWLGTRGGGLVRFDRKQKVFVHFRHDPNDPNSLSDNVVHCLIKDHKGQLWISTPVGINRFNKDGTFTRFSTKDGLPNNYVYGILEDSYGNLWMSTNKGIVRMNVNGSFRIYDVFDGLQSNEFNDGSYHHSRRTGAFFFGGVNGLTVFHPDSIRDNPFRSPVIISRLQYYAVEKNSSQLVEEKGIGEKKSIVLNHQRKTLVQVEFAALSFSKPNKNQYAYKLEGLQREWIPLGN